MDDLKRAKEVLEKEDYTLVLCSGDDIYMSRKRGVAPLVEFLESGKNFSNFSAADKTVGSGAAHIYVLLGVKSIWAKVISDDAKKLLNDNKIEIFYDNLVPYIINRTKDGRCPVENCVQGISDSKEAFLKIKELMLRL